MQLFISFDSHWHQGEAMDSQNSLKTQAEQAALAIGSCGHLAHDADLAEGIWHVV